jgi:serine/threonine-protein kinase
MNEAPGKPPLVGQVLAGKYRVERVLGSGGMGVVVAATHLDLRELRAVKLMHAESAANPRSVERFLREARAAAQLRSDHVAAVLDVGRLETGVPYIVMEHLTGSDLGKISKLRGPLPFEDAALYVAQAATAIAEAHAAGIVHRDLKPSNLFLTKARDGSPCVKVLDFGISKMTRADGDSCPEVTRTTELMGSPLYMAPEQMRSSRMADTRSDVWGLGVILYKLVTARLPFHAKGLLEICTVVLERPPVPPSALRADIPEDLEEIILRCLVKDPAKRLASAADLAAALTRFLERRPSGPPVPVELADEPDAPVSVGARTTSPDLADDTLIPVDLVDEPDEPRVRPAPAPAEHAAAPRKVRTPVRAAQAPRRRRARGALAVLFAVLAGTVGSLAALAAGGTLVSQDQPLAHVRVRSPLRPAGADAVSWSPAPTEPPPARAGTFVAAACPVARERPANRPGGPDDPFRLLDPQPR